VDTWDAGLDKKIWCNSTLMDTKLLIGICYRSPTSSEINNNHLLDTLDREVSEVSKAKVGKMH
jgi:hypothetical protein